MRPLILTSLIFLTACAKETEYVTIRPDIPAETLTPCEISDRKVRTVNELAALATEHLRSGRGCHLLLWHVGRYHRLTGLCRHPRR